MNLKDFAEDNSLKILGVSFVLLVAAVAVAGSGFLMEDRVSDDDMERMGAGDGPTHEGMEASREDEQDMRANHSSERYDISDMSEQELGEQEVEDIRYMRQEESLAHDVYDRFYEEYGVRAFDNIKYSEQTHAEVFKELIEKYGLEDSYNESTNSFESQEITELKDKLVERGMEGEVEALKVAVEIEEMNVAHLREKLNNAENRDLQEIYSNLLEDSKRHLTAFDRQLDMRDVEYTPNHISKSDYEEITADTGRGR
ncbi:MAG: DUF2202 domain-containing protein [Candidatus Nanosalina sp.]